MPDLVLVKIVLIKGLFIPDWYETIKENHKSQYVVSNFFSNLCQWYSYIVNAIPVFHLFAY
jgi:hypothetical protein